MSDLMSSVLAKLAASYTAPESEPIDPSFLPESEGVVIGRNLDAAMVKAIRAKLGLLPPKAQATVKAALDKGDGSQAAPIGTPRPRGVELPAAGSLEAKGFLVAMRRAKNRDESIFAIAAYCGFDTSANYGAQETAAKMRAQRELHPIKVDANEVWRRNGSPVQTVAGYVAGLPDMTANRLANLEAQEVVATESLLNYRNEFLASTSRPIDERAEIQIKMMIERARINEIRAELRNLGKKCADLNDD